ncbi:MAG: helix-hairpin-helix domain-containing protein [Bacteroidetes bacterium]|nr:helix-hairpin-helix domain-containing protein [Bacteroidota bacterium]
MQPSQKHPIKNYFVFTASERRAVVLILIIAVFLFLLPHLFPFLLQPKTTIASQKVLLAEALTNSSTNNKQSHASSESLPAPSLFPFDPNTIGLEEWMRLGVKPKTAQTILNYRTKGGRFRSPDDLKKIWGLRSEQVQQLIPYVRITDTVKKTFQSKDYTKKNPQQVLSIEINTASLEEWESLRGIGPGLAARILKFKEKLGGYISVEQVGETYGLPDSVFQQIQGHLRNTSPRVSLLNINELNEEALSKHPYIRYQTAKAIIRYREQHGAYQSLTDLEKIEAINPETRAKIIPYLTVK